MFEKLFGNSGLELLIGISSCNKIHGSQALSPYVRQWGKNKNTLIYYIAYGTGTKDPAYYIVLVSILHQTFGKDTEVSRLLKLISWWGNNMNRGLVVVVLISDWIKLYSGYNSIELHFSGLEQYYDGFNTRIQSTDRVHTVMVYNINYHLLQHVFNIKLDSIISIRNINNIGSISRVRSSIVTH